MKAVLGGNQTLVSYVQSHWVYWQTYSPSNEPKSRGTEADIIYNSVSSDKRATINDFKKTKQKQGPKNDSTLACLTHTTGNSGSRLNNDASAKAV